MKQHLLLAALCLSLASPATHANLIVNGSFEQDTGGVPDAWAISGTAVTSSNFSSDGIQSLVIGFGNGAVDAIISQSFTTTPGASYTLESPPKTLNRPILANHYACKALINITKKSVSRL